VPKDVLDIIEQLDKGEIRVCDNIDGEWVVNEEAKQTIISLFQLASPSINVSGGAAAKCVPVSYDKIPLKFASWQEDDFAKAKIRVGHGAVVRYGVFLDSNVVLMNCFVNIGAHIGEGTMVDSFATVGSCARVGKRCHIAAGVVIGGVLEPVNARPVIIEDDCLLGAHVAVVEGVIVRCGATIAMGTRLGASTKIIERDTGREFDGEVPECAVVVPGFYEFAGLHISCAVIVGYNRQGTSGVGRKSKEKPEERDGINVTLRFGTE
jgi:2,3,4,5-tetrahydropyridine-2,6-dicarboxylate N-succinyltransferase